LRRKKRKSDRSKRRPKKSNFGRAASLTRQSKAPQESISVLDDLRKDKRLRRKHNVSNGEVEMLSRLVNFGCNLGRIHSLRDLIYVLNTIRHPTER